MQLGCQSLVPSSGPELCFLISQGVWTGSESGEGEEVRGRTASMSPARRWVITGNLGGGGVKISETRRERQWREELERPIQCLCAELGL